MMRENMCKYVKLISKVKWYEKLLNIVNGQKLKIFTFHLSYDKVLILVTRRPLKVNNYSGRQTTATVSTISLTSHYNDFQSIVA